MVTLRWSRAQTPIYLRTRTSDVEVFHQVFLQEEYACAQPHWDVQLIIDAGANVGYTSLYMLSRYPNAHVIAIEPDLENFQILTLNLQHEKRVTLLHGALWPKAGYVALRATDVEHWRRQVREVPPGTSNCMPAFDVNTVLRGSRFDRISILKLDIEGAETGALNAAAGWIENVDHLIVELHQETIAESSAALGAALAGRGFEKAAFSNLIVCSRTSRANLSLA